MRLTLLLAATAGVLALALATGLLKPGLSVATLERHADRDVADCLRHAGFARAGDPAAQPALNRCWSRAARNPSYARLELADPVADERRLRAKGFRTWACMTRAGHVRLTGIPLSGPGGYPLQLAAGNFRVGPGDAALEAFYRDAARCSGERLESFRWSDGTFSREPADGTRCFRHRHGGGAVHAHGCAFAGGPDPRGTRS